MSKMPAAIAIKLREIQCDEIPVPFPTKDKVLVKTKLASICGSDLHRVMMGALMEHQLPCPHGYPGHEGVGQVVESFSKGIPEGTYVLTFPNTATCEGFNEFQRISMNLN